MGKQKEQKEQEGKTKWCFTINNPTEEDYAECRRSPPVHPVQWIGFESETGDEGTPHIQGALVLTKRKRFSTVKELPSMKRAHLEYMKGRLEHSVIYCSKEANFEEYGIRPQTNQQNGDNEKLRWKTARNNARERRFDDVDDQIYVQHYGNIHKIAADELHKEPPQRERLDNYWIMGPSGCGKTKAMLDRYGKRAYIKKCDNIWWDGYDPALHSVVVIDDICPAHAYQLTNIKLWMDHRAFSAEYKGGVMLIRPETLIITSNHSIRTVFASTVRNLITDDDVVAVERRFIVIDCWGKEPIRYDPPKAKVEDLKCESICNLMDSGPCMRVEPIFTVNETAKLAMPKPTVPGTSNTSVLTHGVCVLNTQFYKPVYHKDDSPDMFENHL